MKTLLLADLIRFPRMTTRELRDSFLIDGHAHPGEIHLTYVDLDRAVVGFAVPTDGPIPLNATPELRAKFFTERRELGALNVGGEGFVHVGNSTYPLNNLDLIYIGRDNPESSLRIQVKGISSRLLHPQLSCAHDPPRYAGQTGVRSTSRTGKRCSKQPPDNLQVHPR